MIKNTKSHKIIVSYSSRGREDYNAQQLRLHESILEHWDGDYWLHSKERDGMLKDSKLFKHYEHEDVPYFFKFTMIQTAREQGYTEIYWLDSKMVLNKDITGLASPIMAFDNLGHPLSKYISDEAVANLNCITYLADIKQIWGGAIGFNFEHPIILVIYKEILEQVELGSFNEGTSNRNEFVAHRHDQAVMSVIFHQHKIYLLPYGNIVIKAHSLPPYEYGQDFYIIYG
jgi:hypothetical protein